MRKFMIAAAVLTAATPALAQNKETSAPIALPAPPAGEGQIVFYRGGGTGGLIGCSINENGQKVSSLSGNRYFIMATTPGRHEFSVKSEATDKLALEVEDGETQFVACKIKMGIMIGRPDIRPATEAEFRAEKKLKMIEADKMGPGPGALRPDQVAAALGTAAPATPAPTTSH